MFHYKFKPILLYESDTCRVTKNVANKPQAFINWGLRRVGENEIIWQNLWWGMYGENKTGCREPRCEEAMLAQVKTHIEKILLIVSQESPFSGNHRAKEIEI